MKKAVLCVTSFPPYVSSASRRVSELALSLVSLNYIVTVLVLNPGNSGAKLDNFQSDAPAHCKIKAITYRSRYLCWLTYLILLFLYCLKADVVIFSYPSASVLLGVPLANLLGRSIIIDIRDIPLVDLEHSLLKVACRYASKIWTVTTWLAGYLASNYNIKPAKILVVSNGINVRLVAEEMVHSIRDPAFFTIVLVGDLDQPYLLTENILRAIPSVSKKISNLRVFVVGEGLKKQYLIELCKQSGISEKITFTGLLSLREVYRLLLSADLSIVGYKTRYHKLDDFMLTVPTKVIESICCGVPLLAIASRNSYLADLIIGNKLGIVIESDEPSVIADSIVDAYSRMENFRQCSESFRNRALAQYDQRQIFINALRSSRL